MSHHGHSTRTWEFRVSCPVYPGETVCVSGNCPQLGNWKHDHPLMLQRRPGPSSGPSIWTGQTKIPIRDVKFRYYVCMIVENPVPGGGNVFIVRRWETNLAPRLIPANETPTFEQDAIFGAYDNLERIEHGWLTAETIVQFKIANGPINFYRKKHKNATIRLKMVSLNLNRQSSISEIPDINSMDYQDSNSEIDGHNTCWPIIEIANINEQQHQFELQDQFGRAYHEDEIMIFQAQILQFEAVAYMIDFYMEMPNKEEVPIHIGFCHVLPVNIRESIGSIMQPISSMRQEPIGQIMIEYVVVRPLQDSPCDLRVSYSKHWKHAWTGLDIGHRGSGNSQKKVKECSTIRENTIASLQQAADHGADFVEFDVQLSKDLVPVLFHDFYVNIGLNQKAKQGGGLTTLRIPVKDLTLSQLHELKVFLVDGPELELCDSNFHAQKISHETEEPSEDPSESDLHEPFPTLQYALENVTSSVGFNVELKWTMQLKDGSYELNNPFELNMFIDIVLQSVLKYAGKRRVVFSCFHPDICVMVRLKQNKYPVVFLTQGTTSRYPEYNDPRTRNTPIAINFALNAGLLGLNMHTEDILRDPSVVKTALSHGLITFCWGDDNNSVATIKYLKELGLNGVIYDRIEQHMEQKESIFVTDDGDEFLQLAACLSPSSPGPMFPDEDSYSNSNTNGIEYTEPEGTNGNGKEHNNTTMESLNSLPVIHHDLQQIKLVNL